mgnify:CR=1 FL=1
MFNEWYVLSKNCSLYALYVLWLFSNQGMINTFLWIFTYFDIVNTDIDIIVEAKHCQYVDICLV